MPDAASDVKAEVEEDGDEPWQEVQNGEEDLGQPALLAEEVNNFGIRVIDYSISKCRIRLQRGDGDRKPTKMRMIHVS
jgi:hypothetical protein